MRIHYHGDNEPATIMTLEELIANFNAAGGWKFRHNESDMRHELGSRGYYEGLHENGHYLVLNIDMLQLEPHPDHSNGVTVRCQHRDDGRGRCIDCGEFI